MKRFVTSLVAFVSGMQVFSSSANTGDAEQKTEPLPFPPEPIGLRPLNYPGENMFAGHRSHSSHSSHRSHRSHRSSSGGSSSYRAPSTSSSSSPTYEFYSGSSSPETPSSNGRILWDSRNYSPTDSGRPALVSPEPSITAPKPKLDDKEKRKLQVMRVQIALKQLGLYNGEIDGILGPKTREAITFFQRVKDLTPNGRMTTETLNALGVKAIQ